MSEMRLYILQRATAAMMVPLIAVHLIVIYMASAKGLTAADILSRTRGSVSWGAFYSLFVVLASVHGAIGVRVVLREWTGLSSGMRDRMMWLSGALLFLLGMRAVAAVVLT